VRRGSTRWACLSIPAEFFRKGLPFENPCNPKTKVIAANKRATITKPTAKIPKRLLHGELVVYSFQELAIRSPQRNTTNASIAHTTTPHPPPRNWEPLSTSVPQENRQHRVAMPFTNTGIP